MIRQGTGTATGQTPTGLPRTGAGGFAIPLITLAWLGLMGLAVLITPRRR